MKKVLLMGTLAISLVLTQGCNEFRTQHPISQGHLSASTADAMSEGIPEPVQLTPSLPEPEPFVEDATHTVVVHDVPVRELLFSLARDADMNLDIDENVGESTVTINAINQTLSAILERIADSADLRYEMKNDVLKVRKDDPFLRNYRIDYLNMARSSKSSVRISTEINSTGQGAGKETGDSGTSDNSSTTEVNNSGDHNFWGTLYSNISMIIGPADTEVAPTDGTHPNILMNRESGTLGVRATQRQHTEIQNFIDEVQMSTRRQVLIEATIAEVKLSDRYQAGIDWSLVNQNGGSGTDVTQIFNDIAVFDRPSVAMTITDVDFGGNLLQTTLRALETFGDVSIMSSPKVMAINNQTALLKVVDNLVYFSLSVDIERGDEDSADIIIYESRINTLPVGLVMSVTPYINEYDSVTLNVRPTISRVVGQVRDPSPALAEANVISEVPIVQVREVESVLKVASGDIAVIGGLMQDDVDNNTSGIPLLSKLPVIGPLFRYQDDTRTKTELVIFIKPRVISQASVEGDMKEFKRYLPDPEKKIGVSDDYLRYYPKNDSPKNDHVSENSEP